MILSSLVAAALFGADPSAQAQPYLSTDGSTSSGPAVGGVIAPAALPAGSTALYAMLGAPDVGVGFRQGFQPLEFEARVLFNYLSAAGLLEVGLKVAVFERGIVQIAPSAALGLEANSGTRYYDKANFGFVGLRPRLGLTTSIRFTDAVCGLALLEIPWSIPLTAQGMHVVPTVGAGVEIHLGGRLWGVLAGNFGLDAIKEPLGVPQIRPGWGLTLGLGVRLF